MQTLVWGRPTRKKKGKVFVLLFQTKHTSDKQNEGKEEKKGPYNDEALQES